MRIYSTKERMSEAAIALANGVERKKLKTYTGADKPGGKAAARRLRQQRRCSSCGKPNGCRADSTCWCTKASPRPQVDPTAASCLCPDCLKIPEIPKKTEG